MAVLQVAATSLEAAVNGVDWGDFDGQGDAYDLVAEATIQGEGRVKYWLELTYCGEAESDCDNPQGEEPKKSKKFKTTLDGDTADVEIPWDDAMKDAGWYIAVLHLRDRGTEVTVESDNFVFDPNGGGIGPIGM